MNVVGQCMEIKSQPDVDEPQRYETSTYEKAMEKTKLFHEDGKVNLSATTAPNLFFSVTASPSFSVVCISTVYH